MYSTVYSPILEYESLSDNPQKELVYAIESAFSHESLAVDSLAVESLIESSKCFGYVFDVLDKYRLVLICNGHTFEMDVIIKDRQVIILKGSFHELKMYLMAKIAKQLNIHIHESEFQYVKRKYESRLNFVYLNDNEIYRMMHTLHLFKGNYIPNFIDTLSIFRTKLIALLHDDSTMEQMKSPVGFGVCLAKYLTDITCKVLSHDVTKLYLIKALLGYETLHEHARGYCRIALLNYHHYDSDYSEILCDIAEWIYGKYFNDRYFNESEIDMDEMD